MKLTTPKIGVLSTIIILASVGAFYAGPAISDLSQAASSGPTGAAFLTGNVKVTHFDKDGQVIGYRQGTNHITANGMMVIMGQVFYGVNATLLAGLGADNVSGTVRWMEIGTGGDQELPIANQYTNALRWNDTDIVNPILGLSPSGNLCLRQSAIIANVSIGSGGSGPAHTAPFDCQSGAGGQDARDCFARHNVTASADFDGVNCEINSIDEAGIFTTFESLGPGNTGGTMFARNTFGSVNLGSADTLRLEWEFTFTDS